MKKYNFLLLKKFKNTESARFSDAGEPLHCIFRTHTYISSTIVLLCTIVVSYKSRIQLNSTSLYRYTQGITHFTVFILSTSL